MNMESTFNQRSKFFQLAPSLAAILLLLLLSPGSLQAAEQSSEYRIIGLFSADRVDDLKKVLADVQEFQLGQVDFDTARVTFKYDLKTLFPKRNANDPPPANEIQDAINRLLTEASTQSFSIRSLSKFPREKLTKVQINIGILDCKGCRYGAYLILMRDDLCEQAIVESNVITAWFDASKTNQAALETALKNGGVEFIGKK